MKFTDFDLSVCGTTSIVSALSGLPLNGGTDFTFDFVVLRASLPFTGFPLGRVTQLAPQPSEKAYAQSGLWLEIPRLGVKMDIVGVPLVGGEWDVTWLGRSAGWLEGSAFPTWKGNSVLTAHVWNADNTADPFRYLDTLRWGDRVYVHAYGRTYVYEVRSVELVRPNEVAKMMKHEELSWLTLVTCREYDPKTGAYRYRLLVRTVLMEVK